MIVFALPIVYWSLYGIFNSVIEAIVEESINDADN